MKRRINFKIGVAVLTLAWIGFVAATVINQSAHAQPVADQLEPPFTFVETPPTHSPDAGFPPPGSTVVMTETFGASFAPIPSLSGSTPAWRIIANPDDTARYYWGRIATGTFSDTVWSATTPITSSPVLTPGVSTYPAGQNTWLIYGPIDLSKFIAARMTFEYYLDAEPGDTLIWAASYDGRTFYGSSEGGGHNSQWLTGTLQLDPAGFAGRQVYLAFAFQSYAAPNGLGPFIRNVRLTGELSKFVYAPAVMHNYPPTPTPTPTATPTPTPTPTATPIPPVHGYTFDEPDPRAPGTDLSQWGGVYKRPSCSGGWEDGQDVKLNHGNPGNSLSLYTTAYWQIIGASPNNTTPTDFDMYIDISPWRLYGYNDPNYPNDGNLYGVIFGASNDTFGSGAASYNYNGRYYRVFFATGNAAGPIAIRLDRCDGGGACTFLSGSASSNGYVPLPAGLVGGSAGVWDRMHIVRSGSLIQIRVNGVTLISKSDNTYTGQRKYGLFIFPSDGNDTTCPPAGNEMRVDFDNIKIYSR